VTMTDVKPLADGRLLGGDYVFEDPPTDLFTQLRRIISTHPDGEVFDLYVWRNGHWDWDDQICRSTALYMLRESPNVFQALVIT